MKNCSTGILFRHSTAFILFVLLLTLFISFTVSAVYAETFRVSTVSDDVPGSLRAAIASAASYDDVISFDVTGTITLSSQLEICNGMKIQGPGADLLTVSGGGVCRVFYIEATAASVDISGISIVSGDAARSFGGGIYNLSDNLTVMNCIFDSNNSGCNAAGMYNNNSSPTVKNCTFSSNSAYWEGGGMYNSNSSPTVTNCTFSLNTATSVGGGMYNYQNSNPTVTNCAFSGNIANDGGGMNNLNSNPAVANCTFSSNSATCGGGMCNSDSSPIVTNCTFSLNTADSGGGMHNGDNSSSIVTNCTFSLNTAHGGGGMYNYENSGTTVTNCTFSLNSALGGGGILNYSDSPTLTNCTFAWNNASSDYGGGMYNYYSSPTVINCIFWNKGDEIYNDSSSPTLSHCVVQSDDCDSCIISGDVTSADPRLVPLADNGGPTWTCALGAGSSAIDSGIYIEAIYTDQRGTRRPWGYYFDIGAYEVDVESFTIIPYWTSGGIITPASTTVFKGESMDFTVSPDISYHIEEIYLDGKSISFEPVNNIYTHTFRNVSADHGLFAVFKTSEGEIDKKNVSGSGGGCSVSAMSVIGLLLVIPIMFLFRKK